MKAAALLISGGEVAVSEGLQANLEYLRAEAATPLSSLTISLPDVVAVCPDICKFFSMNTRIIYSDNLVWPTVSGESQNLRFPWTSVAFRRKKPPVFSESIFNDDDFTLPDEGRVQCLDLCQTQHCLVQILTFRWHPRKHFHFTRVTFQQYEQGCEEAGKWNTAKACKKAHSCDNQILKWWANSEHFNIVREQS